MRICSFLPSATEILYALGLGDAVVGVTHECDYPSEARNKPIVVTSRISDGLSASEIDSAVSATAASGESLYKIDRTLLHALEPDLIVTQELCDVCAVSTSHLLASVRDLTHKPRIVSLTPHTLTDVFSDIERLGQEAGVEAHARELVEELGSRLKAVRSRADGLSGQNSRRRVACLEWLDPPFNAGHWVPEMVHAAGGLDVLGNAGTDSVRVSWAEVMVARPDIVLVMPCGYGLQEAARAWQATEMPPKWESVPAVQAGRVFAVDANSYFSRPGPRLIDGVEILFELFSEQNDVSMSAQHPAFVNLVSMIAPAIH